VNNSGKILTDPDKILRLMYAKLISHVLKFWRPGPKGRKMAAKKVGVFCNGCSEVVFIRIGMDRHEIRAKNVNRRCALSNLNSRILKIFP